MDEFYMHAIHELEEMGVYDYIKTEVREDMGMVYTAVLGFTDDAPEELVQRYLLLCAEYGIEVPWIENQNNEMFPELW